MITTDIFSSRHTSQASNTALSSGYSQKSSCQSIFDKICALFEALGKIFSSTKEVPVFNRTVLQLHPQTRQ